MSETTENPTAAAVRSNRIVKRLVEKHYAIANEKASQYVESVARQILSEHNLGEFVMCMGLWTVTDKEGNDLKDNDPRLAPLTDFIADWDDYLKITGEPMRFTATGKTIRNW